MMSYAVNGADLKNVDSPIEGKWAHSVKSEPHHHFKARLEG